MGTLEVFIIAVGLAMDAFAAAVCQGLNMKKLSKRYGVVIAFCFGTFQAVMPCLGWLLGRQFEHYIITLDHYIAFILLSLIGINMIKGAFVEEELTETFYCIDYKEILIMAIATSVDALAVGVMFAFIQVNIFRASAIIGTVAFCLSFIGVLIGNYFGARFQKSAEVAGGIILILMGTKILLEHIGFLML